MYIVYISDGENLFHEIPIEINKSVHCNQWVLIVFLILGVFAKYLKGADVSSSGMVLQYHSVHTLSMSSYHQHQIQIECLALLVRYGSFDT